MSEEPEGNMAAVLDEVLSRVEFLDLDTLRDLCLALCTGLDMFPPLEATCPECQAPIRQSSPFRPTESGWVFDAEGSCEHIGRVESVPLRIVE